MGAAETDYDVAVIGAGINGAGIARDAAMRGLRVLVLEKQDMCAGTSAASSRLIHGGLRYLEYGEIPLVYESLHERRHLRVIAAHLVKPLRITIPIYKDARRGRWLVRLGMLAYDLLSWNKSMPGHDMLSAAELQEQEPGLNAGGLMGAARYFDAQVTFAERLVLENLLAAKSAGATLCTYCEVVSLPVSEQRIESVEWITADARRHRANVGAVINAGGPWVDRVLQTAPVAMRQHIGGTKGSHIVVPEFAGAPQDAFYVEAASDGRPFFILPWHDQYLIGTTDIRYNGNLDKIRASSAEVDYLLDETNRVFPGAKLKHTDVRYSYAGVRPLPFKDKGPESAITRRHIITVNRDIASNLVSIVGGKLTTYRNLAEQSVDLLAKVLHRRLPRCRTADTLLPGGWGIDKAREALVSLQVLPEQGVARLLDIYGGRAAGIAARVARDPGLLNDEILAAEIDYVAREEFPRSLTDIVFRRTMLGLRADQGRPLWSAVGEAAAAALEWDQPRLSQEIESLTHYADSLLVTDLNE